MANTSSSIFTYLFLCVFFGRFVIGSGPILPVRPKRVYWVFFRFHTRDRRFAKRTLAGFAQYGLAARRAGSVYSVQEHQPERPQSQPIKEPMLWVAAPTAGPFKSHDSRDDPTDYAANEQGQGENKPYHFDSCRCYKCFNRYWRHASAARSGPDSRSRPIVRTSTLPMARRSLSTFCGYTRQAVGAPVLRA